jgi:peptidoglycan/LPS O-acetylase OafA/YrhL
MKTSRTGTTNSRCLALAPFVILFAWVAVKFFDEPIRSKIRRYSLQKRN